MPVETVVICGVRRGRDPISAEEFRQFSGRAGRRSGVSGKVTVICPREDEEIALSLVASPTTSVRSRMSGVLEISFRALPCIGNAVYDEESFSAWLSRSLGTHQGISIKASWSEVIGFLIECGCVDGELNRTVLGDISVRMMVRPENLMKSDERCMEVIEMVLASSGFPLPPDAKTAVLDPLSLSYVSAPLMENSIRSFDIPEEVSERYSRACWRNGFQSDEFLRGGCLAWSLFPKEEDELQECGGWSQMPRSFREAIRDARKDYGRILSILEALFNNHAGIQVRKDEFRLWSCSVENAVPLPAARLMTELPALGRKTATALADAGVESIEHLRKNPELADGILSEEAVSSIISE